MINLISETLKEAGQYTLSHFQEDLTINYKIGDELVTKIDHECEKLIKEKILNKFPDHRFWGEEQGQTKSNSDWTWIVDPVDGSVNYSRHISLFGISIAAVHKNKVQAAGVFNPITQELFLAERNNGTTLNGKKVSVSKESNLNHSIVYSTELFKSFKYISPLFNLIKNLRITSSSAYETCLVASGRTEAFIKITTHPWGFAAANLIVEEAGGKVTNFDGTNWDINSTHILSSNGLLHNNLLELINLK